MQDFEKAQLEWIAEICEDMRCVLELAPEVLTREMMDTFVDTVSKRIYAIIQ